jgi:anthranilate phosphoribosyltransferase
VYDVNLTQVMAETLAKMGSQGAYVVHGYYETGAGLDELTTTGPSRISWLHNGIIESSEFDPAELGFERATLADLQGSDAETNAQIARDILSGKLTGPKRDVVLLNAAAALSAASGDLAQGLARATDSLESGAAADTLRRYVEKTQSFAAQQT